MATIGQARATLDDLYRAPGKAELIAGRVVEHPMTGFRPHVIASLIFMSLYAFVKQLGRGYAFNDGLGFAVPILPSGRESFAPDAGYFGGPLPQNTMRFISGPPTFAVELRSENDYGASAESEMAAKRLDYFQAGTLAVWAVDPIGKTVTLYKATAPTQAVVFRRGEVADAEPAVPGWRVAVDDVFA